jgi:hypothetical protein
VKAPRRLGGRGVGVRGALSAPVERSPALSPQLRRPLARRRPDPDALDRPPSKDAATASLETRLGSAADPLRANSGLTAAQYSQPVLGLIFLRFADARFAARRAELEKGAGGRRGSRGEDVDEPAAVTVHADRVPERADSWPGGGAVGAEGAEGAEVEGGAGIVGGCAGVLGEGGAQCQGGGEETAEEESAAKHGGIIVDAGAGVDLRFDGQELRVRRCKLAPPLD